MMTGLPTADEAIRLLERQLAEWPETRARYEALDHVCERTLEWETFSVRVQWNPARIASSAAKVDAQSLSRRPCFLCPAHLPAEQLRREVADEYQLLVNPFPIFPMHWTVPARMHVPQTMKGRWPVWAALMKAVRPLVVCYNGPRCGASAPDHFHWQLGTPGFLPVEQDRTRVERCWVTDEPHLRIYALKNYLRQALFVESDNEVRLAEALERIVGGLPCGPGEAEPGMNVLAWWGEEGGVACVLPRRKHRPACYEATGETHRLISPGAVDMGGVLITPRREDYERLTAAEIEQIYEEVSLADEAMDRWLESIAAHR